jgi:hypothetical protein
MSVDQKSGRGSVDWTELTGRVSTLRFFFHIHWISALKLDLQKLKLSFRSEKEQWVETNSSNIRKHPYFPYGHLFLSPHGTTLMAFDTDVRRENTDVRWVSFHLPRKEFLSRINQNLLLKIILYDTWSLQLHTINVIN